MPNKQEIEALKKRATPETYSGFRKLSAQRTCGCFWDSHKEARIGVFQKDGLWLFKCPKCDKGGDIFRFIQESRQCAFPEAIKLLREALGESAPRESRAVFNYNQGQAAARLSEVLEFLAKRGIDPDVARAENVGTVDHHDLGLAVSLPYRKTNEKGVSVVKFRAINPRRDENGRLDKFRHLYGADTNKELYGWPLSEIEILELGFNPYLWIVESELDTLLMKSHGENAISVGSATGSLNKGELKYPQEVFDTLAELDIKILIATDMDSAGETNAAAWLKKLQGHQAFRVKWPYAKGTPDKPSDDPKDIGDLYAKDPSGFRDKLQQLKIEALARPPLWREKFHTVDELPDGDIDFLIEGILPEGVAFVGALSGVGKTWFALSLVRALTTGKKFLGNWRVANPVNVLYLCPEMNAKPFKRRCKLMGISERFYCQTVSDGVPISLDDSTLAMAIRDLSPVIFLDTAIRFSDAEDENSASQNARGLAEDIKTLQYLGARAIVCLHHRGKAASESEAMTLENVLRGTGDFGALCDVVFGLQHDRGEDRDPRYIKESKRLTRLHVAVVKARDFTPPDDFIVQLDVFIDEIGDFCILAAPEIGDSKPVKTEAEEIDLLVADVTVDPTMSDNAMHIKHDIGRNRIPKLLAKAGWKRNPETGCYEYSLSADDEQTL